MGAWGEPERREERGVPLQDRVHGGPVEDLAAGAPLAVVDGAEDPDVGEDRVPAAPRAEHPPPFGDRRYIRRVDQ